jgi:hypothetical protein
MYARMKTVMLRSLFYCVAVGALALGCSAASEGDETGSEESNLTGSDASYAKIRDAVKDVEQEHVTFPDSLKAPNESAGSGAEGKAADDGKKASLFGVDWFQKWAGGKTADHDWSIGSDYGKRCMWASVARFEAIMKDNPPPELAAFLSEYTKWSGGFYNWNDDYGGKSEDGKPAVGDAKNARLWAWRTTLTKWISATAKDGSCYLPTRSMVVKYIATCKAHTSTNDGEMQGCEVRGGQ